MSAQDIIRSLTMQKVFQKKHVLTGCACTLSVDIAIKDEEG